MALKVFISSKMAELRDVREIVGHALRRRGIKAFVYEESAGARPETVVTTSLQEVDAADVYVGLFCQKYGEVTVEEYRHARKHNKPCFVYIRDKDLRREPELDAFLKVEIYDLTRGVTYDYFDSALQLGDVVARDVMAWLERRYRELSAQVRAAEVSRKEIEHLQEEVAQLQSVSWAPLPQGSAVDILARQLREWFGAVGYGLERDVERSGVYAELIINTPRRRRGYDRVLVRAQDGAIEVSHVRDLRRAVDEHRFDEGWLVCERRVSKAAREETETYNDLFVYTLDELIDEEVDWDRYFVWLENEVKTKGVDKYYVHLAGQVDDLSPEGEKLGTSYYEKLDDYVDLWLDDPSKEHISILGEFGTGKTWFTLHYAYRMMQRYQEAKAKGLKRPRVPLIIQLRNYAQGFKDVGALLSEFVFREHEIGLPGYRAFEQLNRMGRLLLIFDGFDEMAARVDRQKMVNNFWELAKVVVRSSKAILTCRTEHFHYARQEREVLRGELRASVNAIVLEAPKFEVLYLDMFNKAQIREVLRRRTDVSTVGAVMNNGALVDMARRPVLIELILEALEEVEAGKPADMAHTYYYAVVRKMERDIKAERTFTSLADKLYFLCEVAWEMLYSDRMSVSYKQFPDRIRTYFGPKVADPEEDHWHYDLLGQTMLVRDAEGNYSPAHRSLLEFFVAYKFAAEMGALQDEFAEAARQQTEIDNIAEAKQYTWEEYFRRERDEKGKIMSIHPLSVFRREPMEHLVLTVGAQPLTLAVATLMEDMVVPKRLWEVVNATKNKSVKKAGYTGGNAATLLRRAGESFIGAQLDYTVLCGVELFNADLTGANLQGAIMQRANLGGCNLTNVNFQAADLSDIQVQDIGPVWAVAWSLDGKFLVGASHNGDLVVCNADTNEVVVTRAHDQAVLALDVSPDSLHIVSGSGDGSIKIWDANSQEEILSFNAHQAGVYAVCYSPCGRFIASGGGDSLLKIWDSSTGKLLAQIRQHRGAVLSLSYDLTGLFLASGGEDGSVNIWNAKSLKRIWSLNGQIGGLLCVHCGALEGRVVTGSSRGCGQVWDIKRGRFIDTFEAGTMAIHDICSSPDGRYVVRGGDGLRFWDIKKLKEIGRIIVDSEVLSVCYSPDGQFLVTGDEDATIRAWDVEPTSPTFGQCVKRLAVKMKCKRAKIDKAKGLDAGQLRFFYERGAHLDEGQVEVVGKEFRDEWDEIRKLRSESH